MEDRCHGDETKRLQTSKQFEMEDDNMMRVVEYVRSVGDTTKAYVILKYIGDDLRWRQLGKITKYYQRVKGDLTTTWSRLFYDNKQQKWKESNYRYEDEIV